MKCRRFRFCISRSPLLARSYEARLSFKAVTAVSRLRPILDRKAGHSPEFGFVVRHKRGAKVFGVCRNQHVIRSDRLAAFRKCSLYPGKIPGCPGWKIFDLKKVQQTFQRLLVLGTECSLLNTKPQ